MMQRYLVTLVLFYIIVGNGCNNKYAASNRAYRQQAKEFAKMLKQRPGMVDSTPAPGIWVGTVNFGMRKPGFVILHHTAQKSCDSTLQTFITPISQVSAHYVICKNGTVHHMLNDYLRAWHAGNSRWGNLADVNSSSIGIEIDNNGFEPFTEAQINSLLILLRKLKKDYNIPAGNFIGHSDIAPKRKVDPSRYFPWQLLAQNGFGAWYDTTGIQLPASFDAVRSLRVIGYDIRDSAAAIRAFKLHFVPQDTMAVLSESERKIIYSLSNKY
ncbi:MAG: N-acetylmuramoyl-L-alanine amidase [Ferruginibacter sp.]|nr:N-acetylmuramoyl-L-alanine amidase [Ferruginibacter sp.]